MASNQNTPPASPSKPSKSSSSSSHPPSPFKKMFNMTPTKQKDPSQLPQKDPSRMPKASVEVVDHRADVWTCETDQGEAELHTRSARLNFTICPPTSSESIEALRIRVRADHKTGDCRILRAMPYVHPDTPIPRLATEDVIDYLHGVYRDTSSTFAVSHTSESSVQALWVPPLDIIDPSHPVPELRLLLVFLAQPRPVLRINYRIDLKIRNINPSPAKRISAVFNPPCDYLEGINYLIELPKSPLDPFQVPKRWMKLNPRKKAGSDNFNELGRDSRGNGHGNAAVLLQPITRPFTRSFDACQGPRTPPLAVMPQTSLRYEEQSNQEVPHQELSAADEPPSQGISDQKPHESDADVSPFADPALYPNLSNGPYSNHTNGSGSTVSASAGHSSNDADISSSNPRSSVSLISVFSQTETTNVSGSGHSNGSTVTPVAGTQQDQHRDVFS